jgi:hypothetical protein
MLSSFPILVPKTFIFAVIVTPLAGRWNGDSIMNFKAFELNPHLGWIYS